MTLDACRAFLNSSCFLSSSAFRSTNCNRGTNVYRRAPSERIKYHAVVYNRAPSESTQHTHINSICRKVARQLNVLRRLSSLLDQDSRMAIFRAFIVSNYCPLVWHFCGKRNTSKIEKLQERALRFVFNDFTSSYDNMLEKAELTKLTLSCIKKKTLALEVYKALHGHSPPPTT